MNLNEYRDKMYNVIMRSVYEDGVYSIVEDVLEVVLDTTKFSIINVQKTCKEGNDKRITGLMGEPGLLIVSDDFEYSNNDNNTGKIISVIEVKAPSVDIEDDNPKELKNWIEYKNLIYTNGLNWKIYTGGRVQEVSLAFDDEFKALDFYSEERGRFKKDWIKKEKFGELLYQLAIV